MTKIAILGGGPAGYIAALRAAQLNADVVLIEADKLGGTCMNVGCIPTKALLKSSEILADIKRAKEFGIDASIVDIDWDSAVARKNRVVKNLDLGIEQLLKAKNVKVISGNGVPVAANRIDVDTLDGTVEVICEKMILATGSSPLIPSIEGIELDGVLTSSGMLNVQEIPENLVIIGAGVIGVEFAEMFRAAGSKVTVIEMQEQILPGTDEDISTGLYKTMKRKGIAFKLSAKVLRIEQIDTGLSIAYLAKDKEETLDCDNILVATGRKLNTDVLQNLSLDMKDGAIKVNEYMETSVPGVYAAGDIIGGQLLAHLAFAEGKAAAENALGMKSKVNYLAVPACVYTSPEIAIVGLTEQQAITKGIAPKTGGFHFRNNGRALTLAEREGYIKVVADENNTIIGGQIFGPQASELISEITLAITLEAKADVVAGMIHPHPSLSEAVWEACSDIIGQSLHQL